MIIAHIGAGRFSRRVHGPVLRRLAERMPDLRLAAVADVDPRRPDRARAFARDFGYRQSFVDVHDMIDAVRPDLIVCTVQASCAAGILEAILARGIPVFTEKPPATTIDAAERLATLARTSAIPTYVAFNRRRIEAIEWARRWIAGHASIHHISAEMRRDGRHEPEFGLMTAIHALDTVRYLGGEIRAIATRRSTHAKGGVDYVVRADLCSGAVADLTIRVDAGTTSERYVVVTDRGRMEIRLDGGSPGPIDRSVACAFQDGRLAQTCDTTGDPLVTGGFLQEHETFVQSVRLGTRVDCTLEDARHSVRAAVALQAGYCGMLSNIG